MFFYLLRRLLTAIPTMFVIVTIAFFLIRVAPGGPFNQERGLSPEIKANLEAQFGLNDPLWLQYWNYLKNLLRGDFGPSYNLPDFTVSELFSEGLKVSIPLGLSALIVALLLGGTLGIIAALNQNKSGDYAVIAVATAGSTIPTFVIAPIIQLLFGLTWKLLPVGGWGGGALINMIGPVLTLALPQMAIVARLMRGSMIDPCAPTTSVPPAPWVCPTGRWWSNMPCAAPYCRSFLTPGRPPRRCSPVRSSSRRSLPSPVLAVTLSRRRSIATIRWSWARSWSLLSSPLFSI